MKETLLNPTYCSLERDLIERAISPSVPLILTPMLAKQGLQKAQTTRISHEDKESRVWPGVGRSDLAGTHGGA